MQDKLSSKYHISQQDKEILLKKFYITCDKVDSASSKGWQERGSQNWHKKQSNRKSDRKHRIHIQIESSSSR